MNWIGSSKQAVGCKGADVPGPCVAALLAVNRLCAPAGELDNEKGWYLSTELDDLLKIDEGKANDNASVSERARRNEAGAASTRRCSEPSLIGRSTTLTSTYVEGEGEESDIASPRLFMRPLARPRASVKNKGFSYQILDRNGGEVSSQETIFRVVERKYGNARRIWISDRGIAAWRRSCGGVFVRKVVSWYCSRCWWLAGVIQW